MTNIVFMHVGQDTQLATIMARSFRLHNPGARIIQVSDYGSPTIEGTDDVFRRRPRDNNIMLFRMRCFSELPIGAPTWFLDTDMLCNRPLEIQADPPMASVCMREFDRDVIFNHRFRGMDMSEYRGRTLGSIYPYVGCTTRLEQPGFWTDCLAAMEKLDPKYHNWYGDQEAIRNVVANSSYPVGMLPESLYACLPEHETGAITPFIMHYKGLRKMKMLERAVREGLM